jgi:hypothetical protein
LQQSAAANRRVHQSGAKSGEEQKIEKGIYGHDDSGFIGNFLSGKRSSENSFAHEIHVFKMFRRFFSTPLLYFFFK